MDIVKVSLNIADEEGDFDGGALEVKGRVCKSSACIKRAEQGEGATLIAVRVANVSGNERVTRWDNTCLDLHDGLAENNKVKE